MVFVMITLHRLPLLHCKILSKCNVKGVRTQKSMLTNALVCSDSRTAHSIVTDSFESKMSDGLILNEAPQVIKQISFMEP